MWHLARRFPALADLLVRLPSLWTTWTFHSSQRSRQPMATYFAISLWRDCHLRGRSLRVSIHTSDHPIPLTLLSNLLPHESLPYVHSLTFRDTRQWFDSDRTSRFLCRLPGLTDVTLSTWEGMMDLDTTLTPCSPVIMSGFPSQCFSSLVSLTLSGVYIGQDALQNLRFSSLETLRVFNLVRPDDSFATIFSLILPAPRLQKLVVHSFWVTRPPLARLFSVPDTDAVRSWVCPIRVLELWCDFRSITPFLNTIMENRHARLDKVRIVFYCRPEDMTSLFPTVPVFQRELEEGCDAISVDSNTHYMMSKRMDTVLNRRDWGFQWQPVNLWRGFWVSLSPRFFSLVLSPRFSLVLRTDSCVVMRRRQPRVPPFRAISTASWREFYRYAPRGSFQLLLAPLLSQYSLLLQ